MTRLSTQEAERLGLGNLLALPLAPVPERRASVPWEENMQIALMGRVFEMEGRYPQLRWIHHSPNGGTRNHAHVKGGMSEAQRFRAMGVRRGYPDLVCHKSARGYRGFAIELKCRSNSPTPEQWDWLCDLEDEGYFTLVVRDNWRDAWGAICWYFGIDEEALPYGY